MRPLPNATTSITTRAYRLDGIQVVGLNNQLVQRGGVTVQEAFRLNVTEGVLGPSIEKVAQPIAAQRQAATQSAVAGEGENVKIHVEVTLRAGAAIGDRSIVL